MTIRLISNASLYRLHLAQGRGDALQEWARANGLEPDAVSADDNLTIEDTADGRVIRCWVFDFSASGYKQANPARAGEPLKLEQVVPLVVEPPEGWPVYAMPEPRREGGNGA